MYALNKFEFNTIYIKQIYVFATKLQQVNF